MQSFEISTTSQNELIHITSEVKRCLREASCVNGICFIYTPHTTAGITINENADPDVRFDIIRGLEHIDFESCAFRHAEGNSPAHLKSSLVGCSEMIIVSNGELSLGTWQGIFFCEFDGPRKRKVFVQFIPQ